MTDVINHQRTHNPTPGPIIESVATILEQEAQFTMNEWLERIDHGHFERGPSVNSKDRCSHLPALFRELIHRLRNPIPLGSPAVASPAAAAHGILRRKQGYSSDMLIEESRILQVSIFHTLNINSHRLNFNLLLPDVMVIADEVDTQLAQAMASYLFREGNDLSIASSSGLNSNNQDH